MEKKSSNQRNNRGQGGSKQSSNQHGNCSNSAGSSSANIRPSYYLRRSTYGQAAKLHFTGAPVATQTQPKRSKNDTDDFPRKKSKYFEKPQSSKESHLPKEHTNDPLFWGPYLSERQWGTVREDYSSDGSNWDYMTHNRATHQAYLSGEDGLLGVCDKFGMLCSSLALWNNKDPILKERLFGLNGKEGNHGEDVKELYYYLDNTPRHTYMRALYKYPMCAFPYDALVHHHRSPADPELEILDTGVFDSNEYWDVTVEYAKPANHTIVCQYTVQNRSSHLANIHIIPQFLFRNTWKKRNGGHINSKPLFQAVEANAVDAVYDMGIFHINFLWSQSVSMHGLLFTNNDSVFEDFTGDRKPGCHSPTHPCKKDAFHQRIVYGQQNAVKQDQNGTKFCAWMSVDVPAQSSCTVGWQMYPAETVGESTLNKLEQIVHRQKIKAQEFYHKMYPTGASKEEANICQQAVAGLLWSKQLYIYDLELKNKEQHKSHTLHHSLMNLQHHGKKHRMWNHLNCHDILLMPDTWEFPWFAAWDLAFHCVQFARINSTFAKEQLLLLLSDRYMHPSGQIPGCEFDLGDTNPPLISWAVWKVFLKDGEKDLSFLKTCFNRLIFSFQWWNRLDPDSCYLYGNGFMGLDNISLLDRSKLPKGVRELKQADCTGWMGLFCLTMLQIALELCILDTSYTDMAIKFLKHFLYIARAINRSVQDGGLWMEEDSFFYDVIHYESSHTTAIRLRSWTGIIPLLACCSISLRHSPLVQTFLLKCDKGFSPFVCKLGEHEFFLTLVSYQKMKSMVRIIFSESELLSPFGIRSLSKVYKDHPYSFNVDGETIVVHYLPGESDSTMFGGNSNWRGPVWLCMNYLFVECLEKYSELDKVFTSPLSVEYPTGKSSKLTFLDIAEDLCRRLIRIFLPDRHGFRPVHNGYKKYAQDKDWQWLVLFYEYFHADTGRGCGANHQTGWSALVVEFIHKLHNLKKFKHM